jgi:hypothetical protein
MDMAALIVSIIAIVISAASGAYTRIQARANQRSAIADEVTAELERDRRHAELTPKLRVICRPANPGSEYYKVIVHLVGPMALGRLDALTVTIRNDSVWRERATPLAGGPTQEEVAAHIWGPLRFTPGTGPGANPVAGVPGADPTGRTVTAAGVPVGEDWIFALEPTRPAIWMRQTIDEWRRDRGTILRLTFECHQEDTEPWTLTGEIDTQTDNPVEIPARP